MLAIVADPDTITKLATAKGIAFVAITTVLLVVALRSVPVEPPQTVAGVKGRSPQLFLVFLLLTVTVAVIGTIAYRAQSASLKRTELDRLQAIAKLKVDDITRWMGERRSNVEVMSRSPTLIDVLQRWQARRRDEDGQRLLGQLREVRGSFGFSGAALSDAAGHLLFADGDDFSTPELMARSAREAVASRQVVFVDLHGDRPGEAAHMAFVAPVFDGQGVIAVVHFDVRADRYLYPYIESWPLPSATGETLLVRREGDDALFLNDLRHRPHSALSFRIPLTRNNLPSVQAIVGDKRLMEGFDYRNVAVLAAALPVPDTPWTLIAKVDADEALAGINQLAFATAVLILAALFVSIAFVVFLWQRQRLQAALSDVAQSRALEEAETRFRATFEQAAVGIAHVGIDGGWLRVNQQLCTILGYRRDELLTKTFQDITFSGDLETDIGALRRLLTGDIKNYEVEKRYVRQDGDVIWVKLTSSLLRDSAGRPDYLIAVVEDISVRKAAEEALRKRIDLQDYLAKIADTLPGAVCSFRMRADGSMCMPYASPNFAGLCGLQPAEVVDDAAPAFRRIHADDAGRLTASLIRSARTKRMLNAEFRVNHPDNGEIWVEARGAPERDADGSTLWHGFLYDITERKKDEAQLRQAMTVFSSTQSGVCVTDAAVRIIAVNPAFTAITGYDQSELIGESPSILRSGRQDADFYRAMWDCLRKDGFWQGEIWNRRKNGEVFPELLAISAVRNNKGALVSYVATFTDIARLKQSESQLAHLAHHDALTDLPNRVLLLSSLEHAIARAKRRGGRGAVLFLDLDRFKNVNDSMGHPVGDQLLVLVAGRLRSHVHDAEVLARLGGDEFVVLLDDVEDPNIAAGLAEALIAQFAQPFAMSGGRQVYVGASIGISVFPDDGEEASVLIQHADAALYQAKENGRGTYRFYSHALTVAADIRLEMETSLRGGLERGEFVLHYQPLVSIADARIVGVEALVRWQRPDQGLVMPDTFIPLAEETGLIVPLGEWVLRTACAQMQAWIEDGKALDTISVNLSPRQLWQSDIHECVRSVLADSGLTPGLLELEITESALLEQDGDSADTLNSLKALGVRLAIDDFGTGYSSLAYLTRLPIDTLKIDKSFVRNIPVDRACTEVTAGIIALTRSLNLEVLAEGIETEAQLDFLRLNNCDRGQGYLFSRPLPAADMTAMLAAFSPAGSGYPRRTSVKKASA